MNKLGNEGKNWASQSRIKHYPRKLFPLAGSILIPVYLLLAAMTPGCSLPLTRGRPSGIMRPPLQVTSISGYFSFRLAKGQETVRGRAFFLLVPGKGRIEVIDPVGRQAIVAIWRGEEEWMIIPAERAYWYGREASGNLIASLLGFPLEPVELVGWIIGRSEGLEPFSREEASFGGEERPGLERTVSTEEKQAEKETNRFFPGWEIERDEKGRLRRGSKAELNITIEEHAPNEQVARLISVSAPSASGRLTVLGFEFNRLIPEENFHPAFIQERGFRAITREELEAWLKRN